MTSVIICTYNRAKSLQKTLHSLAAMTLPADWLWEVIVVDNNSCDDTRAVVAGFARTARFPLRYVFEGRQGLCQARNTGLTVARSEVIAFTDDDVTVAPYWLWHLKRTFDQFNCLGVGGRIIPVWTCQKPSWLELAGPQRLMSAIVSFDLGEEPREVKTPPFGANMAFKKLAFAKYGLFRTDLDRSGSNLLSGGDTEFGRRLLQGQERLVYAPHAVVYHPVEPQRTEKKYFQRWYFDYGRSSMRYPGVPANAPCYFGVPAYLLRRLCASFLHWAVTLNLRQRFHHKLRLYQVAGAIAESYRLARQGK